MTSSTPASVVGGKERILREFPRFNLHDFHDYDKAGIDIALSMVHASWNVLSSMDWCDAMMNTWLSKDMVPVWSVFARGDPEMTVLLSKLPHYNAEVSGIDAEAIEAARAQVASDFPPTLDGFDDWALKKQCEMWLEFCHEYIKWSLDNEMSDIGLFNALKIKVFHIGATTLLSASTWQMSSDHYAWLQDGTRQLVCRCFGAVDWISNVHACHSFLC